MIPALKITQQEWMKNAALARIMAALGPGRALLVGGVVRDAVRGDPPGDIDIATVLTPDEATKALESAGIRVVPTGIEHGTVTAVADHKGYEITTLRRDVETDGRRAVVAFTTEWRTDIERRDFTINTLLMDMDGQVYDLTGQGIADLKAGRVRFVGDPQTRIREDALRILRFFRFHARYGSDMPDAAALAACQNLGHLIETLSRERITQELLRLFPAKRSGASIQSMIAIGLMADLWSKYFTPDQYVKVYVTAVNKLLPSPEILLLAYSLYDPNPDVLDLRIKKYLVLSNRHKDSILNCMKFLKQHADTEEKNLYLFGQQITLSGMILSSVLNAQNDDPQSLEALVDAIRRIPVPVLPVRAQDVMDVAKIPQGREVGALLQDVESWWLAANTKPDRDQCLAYLKTRL